MPGRRQHGGVGHRHVVALPHDRAAGQDELGVDAVGLGQLLHRPGQEMIDVALVVGEQDPRLDGAPVGSRVVQQAAQRVVDPKRVEQGERPRFPGFEHPGAVGDLVADIGQHRRREIARQLGDREIAVDEFVAGFGDERIRDLLVADADIEGGAELLAERPQLLEQVLAEERRLRDGRRVKAGRLELRPGAAREAQGAGRLPVDAQLGIAEGAPFLRRRHDA